MHEVLSYVEHTAFINEKYAGYTRGLRIREIDLGVRLSSNAHLSSINSRNVTRCPLSSYISIRILASLVTRYL